MAARNDSSKKPQGPASLEGNAFRDAHMQNGTPFNPASNLAHPITHLFVVLGIIMVVILLLVVVLVFYACFRYRHRPGAAEPRQDFGRKGFEIAWTIAPLFLLVYIFTVTVHAMHGSDPAISMARQPDMVIVGHQWWWEARYLDSHVVAANEIHIPTGKLLLVRLESADVIHDWWVPQLQRIEMVFRRIISMRTF